MCDWLAGEVLVFNTDGNREVVARVNGLPRLAARPPGGAGGALTTVWRSGMVAGMVPAGLREVRGRWPAS